MLIANLAMPHRMRLIGVAILLIPQLYLPGLPVSLAVLWTLMTCLTGMTAHGRSRSGSSIVMILGFLIAVTAVSLLWALPSGLRLGVTTVLFGVVFLLWLREMIVVARDESELLDTVVLWSVPGVALQSVLSIAFQINPAIEEQFLRSRLAAITVGPAAAHLYTDLPNNVLDPHKSGGFFVNGNVASLFGGVAALLLCVAARRTMHHWLYAFAALSFAGSIFTGSKSVVFIGAGAALVVMFLPHMRKGSAVLIALSVVLSLPLVFPLLTSVVERIAPTFYANSDFSYGARERLWSRAAQMFQETPILGPGFGGWVEQIGKIGSRSDLPPHNVLVATWAYSGIVAVVLAVVFIVAAIAFGIRVVAAQPTVRDRRNAAFALSAIAWVFIHGMGDNTALYGDRQTMILIAVAFGYLYSMVQDRQQGLVSDENQMDSEHSSENTRLPSTTASLRTFTSRKPTPAGSARRGATWRI
ncbi:O-antigen ligase family protein [Mycobacterium sp. MMS18-G62]